MRLIRNIFLFFAILAVVLIGICAGLMRVQATTHPGDVTGRNMTSQTRPITAEVVIIETDGPIDVVVHQGAVAAIQVRAEQRMLPKITTQQQGNILRIDTHGLMIGSMRNIQVDVTLPTLQKIQQHGSGDVRVSGFSGDQFELLTQGSGEMALDGQFKQIDASLHGSGDLTLAGGSSDKIALDVFGSGNVTSSGQVKTLRIAIAGSGDVDASDLKADQIVVDVTGSGDGVVYARQSAKVNVRGSGNVDIKGAPAQRDISSSGSGDIRFE